MAIGADHMDWLAFLYVPKSNMNYVYSTEEWMSVLLILLLAPRTSSWCTLAPVFAGCFCRFPCLVCVRLQLHPRNFDSCAIHLAQAVACFQFWWVLSRLLQPAHMSPVNLYVTLPSY